jgi:hypothetical protein
VLLYLPFFYFVSLYLFFPSISSFPLSLLSLYLFFPSTSSFPLSLLSLYLFFLSCFLLCFTDLFYFGVRLFLARGRLLNKLTLTTDASTHMSRPCFRMIETTGLSTTAIQECRFDT